MVEKVEKAKIEVDATDFDESKSGWESEIDDWIDTNKNDSETLIFTLYKKNKDKAKEQVYEWEDEIPRSHLIGCRFGGGSFLARVRLPDLKGKKRVLWRSFLLSDEYNIERDQYLQELKNQAGPVPVATGRSDLDTLKFLMTDFIRPMLEMFKSQTQVEPMGGNAWKMASETVNTVMAESMRSQISFAKEIKREMASMQPEKPEPMESEGSVNEWKDLVKDLIKEHGPTLIEAGMLKLKAFSYKLKKEETFVQMSQSPIMLGKVVDALKADPEMQKPEVKLDEVLDKLSKMGIGFQVTTKTEKINQAEPQNV